MKDGSFRVNPSSDPLKCLQNLILLVTEDNRPAVGAAHWVLRLLQFIDQPKHLRVFQMHVDFDRSVAGDRGSDFFT